MFQVLINLLNYICKISSGSSLAKWVVIIKQELFVNSQKTVLFNVFCDLF